ncbi:MAG: UDP-3-O-acyl-N-acetylglucosamine deacetylase [Phycisphaerales bacterium]|nr:UDP-3-O-acyl-N-acetylglucosamine deacetylase [Planctomycetota bacterium]
MPVHTTTIRGTGLFSAKPASVEIVRAPQGTGIRFLTATDIVPATIAHLAPARGPLGGRNSVLARGAARVETVEHVLSALAGSGAWNADVRTQGDEIPILDGSASGFLVAAESLAGSDVRPVRLTRICRVEDDRGAWIEAAPAGDIRYRFELSYPAGSGVPDQNFEWKGDANTYRREIAPARTYCLEKEALAMRSAGLFPHLTPKDMLVIAPDGSAIDNQLRFPDEPVRHKMLDLIGDLALLGGPLIAAVTAHRSSHALTHELCRRIAADTLRT